jgi:leucine dehydrogenase
MSFDLFRTMSELHYGSIHYCRDEATGLQAIIAVHNTRLGPAIGGCRFVAYPDTQAATVDALRLARAMAYKAAIGGLDNGGGKAVIIRPHGDFDRHALFARFGRFVESLGGTYVTCEDSGTTTADMDSIATTTRLALGSSRGSGDPSPLTALGVRRGIESAVALELGRRSLDGVRVAIQGVGNVGANLARELVAAGAHVTISDVNHAASSRLSAELGVDEVDPDDIVEVECDVFAPCALGAVINDESIDRLRCRIIAGAANNQLAEDRHGAELHRRGILFCPDYAINAGGLINVAWEYLPGPFDAAGARARVENIGNTVREILERARHDDTPPHIIADRIAEERMFGHALR